MHYYMTNQCKYASIVIMFTTSSSLARTSTILRHVNKIDFRVRCWKPHEQRLRRYSNSQRQHAFATSAFDGNFEVKNVVGADRDSTSISTTSTSISSTSDKMIKRKFTLRKSVQSLVIPSFMHVCSAQFY